MSKRFFACSLLLAVAAHAQTASYKSFGTACPGSRTAARFCYGQNMKGGPFRNQPQNALEFALKFTATKTEPILGFEFFCKTQSAGSVTFATSLYAGTTKPIGTPLRRSTMTVGSQLGWYRTTMTPFVVTRGQTYFIAYNGDRRCYFPHIQRALTSQHCWRGAGAWSGPWTNPYWAWRVVCPGTRLAPKLSASSLPALGRTCKVDLNDALGNTAAIFTLGTSKTSIGTIPLPLDFSPLGAVGCKLYTSVQILIGTPTSAKGEASIPIPIPINNRLRGFQFYNQWIIFDKAANRLGMVFSNAGHATIY